MNVVIIASSVVVALAAVVTAFRLGLKIGAYRHARALEDATAALQGEMQRTADESFAALRQAIREELLEEIAAGSDDDEPPKGYLQ